MQYDDSAKHRLRRIEGQVRGVLNMMEQEQTCQDVVTQLSAIRSALDRVTLYVIGQNVEQCLREEIQKPDGGLTDEVLKDAIALFMKSR
ncbi:metal-sensitive transcriptional regulator [Alicyclobacillus mengziensis]|uniref:Metal-sensitive transcriptional regulator n=1 Tax=Alicyclobacillus mengziensis TaxID=2931921 RepID=A0A9X7Z7K7_9BACL|nr:metal-sensitive transcriptional regulator [Alicyclobacillus mengziensis]QSO48527.1 metal-sensitive transcriptional regulator [Alicyclobacillus mengziensis]